MINLTAPIMGFKWVGNMEQLAWASLEHVEKTLLLVSHQFDRKTKIFSITGHHKTTAKSSKSSFTSGSKDLNVASSCSSTLVMIVVWNIIKQWISWFCTIINAVDCNVFFIATGWVIKSSGNGIKSLVPENSDIEFVWIGYTIDTIAFVTRTVVETSGNRKMFDGTLIGTKVNGASTINSSSSKLNIGTTVGISSFDSVPDLSWPWALKINSSSELPDDIATWKTAI